MITNIVAAIVVTIATNTTEVVTKWEKSDLISDPCPDGRMGCTVFHGHYRHSGPLEKLISTSAVKTTKLEFEWNGKQAVEFSETLWKTNVTSQFKTEWVNGPPVAASITNGLPGNFTFNTIFFTNQLPGIILQP